MFQEERIVGPKGQVVIPIMFRREFGLSPGDKVVFRIDGDKLFVEPSASETVTQLPSFADKVIRPVGKLDLDKDYAEMQDKRWKKSI